MKGADSCVTSLLAQGVMQGPFGLAISYSEGKRGFLWSKVIISEHVLAKIIVRQEIELDFDTKNATVSFRDQPLDPP